MPSPQHLNNNEKVIQNYFQYQQLQGTGSQRAQDALKYKAMSKKQSSPHKLTSNPQQSANAGGNDLNIRNNGQHQVITAMITILLSIFWGFSGILEDYYQTILLD